MSFPLLHRLRDCLTEVGLALVLVVMLGSATKADLIVDGAAYPPDAQSTTGPVPPPGISRGISPPDPDYQVIISGVPAYIWYNGCGPTAEGMLLGYWDGRGFGNLVEGDASTQTQAVDDMMSSSGNYLDYCLPIDNWPDLFSDLSEPPPGDEHVDDCVADFMETSQSYYDNRYGWSWYSDMDDALREYVAEFCPNYSATVENLPWGAFTWERFCAEIDANRPVILLVDTDGNGSTDHFVTALGYGDQTGTNSYACRNTWDTWVHWYDFAQMSYWQPWGIYGATTFSLKRNVGYVPDDNLHHTSP